MDNKKTDKKNKISQINKNRKENKKEIKNRNNILMVGAHPDDIELGCGGAIVKHLEKGDNVFILVLTNGEQGKHTQTKEECFESLKSLGIKDSNIVFGNFPDGYVSDNVETVNFIEQQIRIFGATKVYTHDPNDRHQDHRHCSNAVSAAARRVPEILLYQGPSTNVAFQPHYFISITKEHMRRKMKALECYKSQIVKNSFNLRWVKRLAAVNGETCNVEYAEAFAVNHIIEGY